MVETGQWRTFDQIPLTSCVQLPTLLKSSIKPVLLCAKGRHCGEYQQDKTVEKSHAIADPVEKQSAEGRTQRNG